MTSDYLKPQQLHESLCYERVPVEQTAVSCRHSIWGGPQGYHVPRGMLTCKLRHLILHPKSHTCSRCLYYKPGKKKFALVVEPCLRDEMNRLVRICPAVR